jgi:hypothetical protein
MVSVLVALWLVTAGTGPPAVGSAPGPASPPLQRFAQAPAPAPEPDPGVPAPPQVEQEIQAVVAEALRRFHAKDAHGLLRHVSEQYRTGVMTKRLVQSQLQTIFGVYDAVRADVRIDALRMVGDQVWIFSTGGVSGRLRFVGTWTDVLWWERELEIARRENGVWRLYGYQQ